MTGPAKSGRELLDSFFEELDDIDSDTAEVVKRLYGEGKLTHTNIANELRSVRESESGS